MNNISNNPDLLTELPTDKNQPTYSELKVIDTLFINTKNEKESSEFLSCILPYIVLIFLVTFSGFIPTDFILNILPLKIKSEITIYIIKGISVAIVFYLLFGNKITFSS